MKIDFTKYENMDFEASIGALESAVKKLEGGNMPLEESIEEFERAMELCAVCNSKLENAERRVRILVESQDGVVTDMPFDNEDET